MSIRYQDKDYSEEEFLSLYNHQKMIENDAKAERVEMEKALLERYGDEIAEEKTSATFKAGRYTLKVTRSITYDLSEKGWDYVWKMPEKERPIIFKYSHTKGKEIPKIFMEELAHETKPTFSVTYK